jgi:nucleotide-binding universal stress UspA family protein
MSDIRVLVPLDGSELAENALRYLPLLNTLGPLSVRLVGVAEGSDAYSLPGADEWQEREARLLTEYLKNVTAEVEGQGIQADYRVSRGRAAQKILDAAQTFKPDFILLSTHGRSGPSRWRVGSVADKVIRKSTCNVLAVGPNTFTGHHRTSVRSIMVPLDGSPLAEEALPVAIELARKTRAQIHLVQAISGLPTELLAVLDTTDLEKVVRGYLSEKAQVCKQERPVVDVVHGASADALQFYAGQEAIDLIVMTSHGRGGFMRAALGSVTDRMLGGVAPVLIVRKQLRPSDQ